MRRERVATRTHRPIRMGTLPDPDAEEYYVFAVGHSTDGGGQVRQGSRMGYTNRHDADICCTFQQANEQLGRTWHVVHYNKEQQST